ncbi:MAG TPA: hypothetical protein V6D13_08065 [Halomicronema sp.]
MRILFTIAHFFNPNGGSRHASQAKDPRPRLLAFSGCISSLHQLYGRSQGLIDIGLRLAVPANQSQSHDIDIIVCTTQNYHLLNQVALQSHLYTHNRTSVEPMLLGFECQAVLRDNLGRYDYFCFLEDDLILHDPWFFVKLGWFSKQVGNLNLLQPNRYEVSPVGMMSKVYIDGDLLPRVTERFQNVQDQPQLMGKVMDMPVVFRRALNPHSGCYFLNAEQMQYWVDQPYFLDRDTSFIGPLESAATLGVMRSFRIYKPAPEHASFLEIQHFGSAFLGLLGGVVGLSPDVVVQKPVS